MNIRKLARFGSAAAAVVALSVTAGAATGTPAASGDPATPAITGVQAIVPGAAWSDQNGTLDQLHGVGMLKVGDTYYAYGEDKTNGGAFTAVACYSSKDLVTWHRGPDALSLQDSGDLGPGRVIERPKVLYNASTGQYVMWMHVDSSNYADARAGVAPTATSAVRGRSVSSAVTSTCSRTPTAPATCSARTATTGCGSTSCRRTTSPSSPRWPS
jgi:hypothetical protein